MKRFNRFACLFLFSFLLVSVASASNDPLTVLSPMIHAKVQRQFDILGTTSPHATVIVRVMTPHSVLASGQVRADKTGAYILPVDTGNLASKTPITVLVERRGIPQQKTLIQVSRA